MKRFFQIAAALVAVAVIVSIAGCGAVGVQVWDRDILSRPEMQMDSPALDRSMDDHIYFSKEASSGGRGFGGGGCGCN